MKQGLVTRVRVLGLYRQIIRTAVKWEAQEPEYTERERRYIRKEALALFRANRNLTSSEDIESRIFEAESRHELAIHYRIPYARSYHIPHDFSPDSYRRAAHSSEGVSRYTPAYMISLQGTTRIDDDIRWEGNKDDPFSPSKQREQDERDSRSSSRKSLRKKNNLREEEADLWN